jgi:hypothetical protein
MRSLGYQSELKTRSGDSNQGFLITSSSQSKPSDKPAPVFAEQGWI